MAKRTTAARTFFGVSALLVAWTSMVVGPAHPGAGRPTLPAGLVVEDIFGRTINRHGLILVDWEGYMANPAIKFYLVPPPDARFPAKAVLTAKEPRLYFNLPSLTGPGGPRKEVAFTKREKVPVYLSIFPDRDGKDEEHRLQITFTDAGGKEELLNLPVRVVDQDQERAEEFSIQVDFTQDKTGFFKDDKKRATIVQAARDWAYFIGDMQLVPVPAGAERTLIWGPDGFKTTKQVTNVKEYTGYLLYAYGIHSSEVRSGGEPSPFGQFQMSGPKTLPIRRSGGVEIETEGNYNTKGWLVSLPDRDWWKATNLGDVQNDLYSIAHHEIGHALFFNPNNRLLKRGQRVDDDRVRAYFGTGPRVSNSDHFERVVDPASLKGAFGNEYHGMVPLGRWLITKLDLLCAQAIGYKLRQTSAFKPLTLLTAKLPGGTASAPYAAKLRAAGGIPFYHWQIVAGALPDGLSLDSFTGEIRGMPRKTGTAEFAVRVRDYSAKGVGETRRFRLVVTS